MSVLIKGLEMPETEYMDVRIFRDGTATLATGTKPYYRELKAEPVRHGKWLRISPAKIYECSECGQNVMTDDIECYAYCQHCGARMDKE